MSESNKEYKTIRIDEELKTKIDILHLKLRLSKNKIRLGELIEDMLEKGYNQVIKEYKKQYSWASKVDDVSEGMNK